MGINSGAKNWILTVYGNKAVFSDIPTSEVTGAIPVVWIFDITSETKHLNNPSLKTGYDYLTQQFLKGPGEAFARGAKIVYGCLDRGSPENKSPEHDKRSKGKKKKAMATPENDRPALGSVLNDYRMPDAEWESFSSNSYLMRRLSHYITMRTIGTRGDIDQNLREWRSKSLPQDYDDHLPDFSPPPGDGRAFMLFGGRLTFPESRMHTYQRHSDPVLVKVESVTQAVSPATTTTTTTTTDGIATSPSAPTGTSYQTKTPPARNVYTVYGNGSGVPPAQRAVRAAPGPSPFETYQTFRKVSLLTESPGWFDASQLKNLLEGEVSALFFAQGHVERGEDVMIITPDGDVLLMLLLASSDRIDRRTGKFPSKIILCLTVGGASDAAMGLATTTTDHHPAKKRKLSGNLYVDINMLWYNVYEAHLCGKPPKPLVVMPIKDHTGASRPKYGKSVVMTTKTKKPRFNENKCAFLNRLFSVVALCGTDYIKGYCFGIKVKKDGIADSTVVERLYTPTFLSTTRGGEVNNVPIPWVMFTFLKYYEIYGRFIDVESPTDKAADVPSLEDTASLLSLLPDPNQVAVRQQHQHQRGGYYVPAEDRNGYTYTSRRPLKVSVNEKMFISFSKRIYVEKYARGKAFYKKYRGSSMNDTHDPDLPDSYGNCEDEPQIVKDTRDYLWTSKKPAQKAGRYAKKKRLPTCRRLRVFSRQLLWQISYYCNAYRGGCDLIDPTTLYKDLPFYGWVMGGKSCCKCKAADRVSVGPVEPTIENYEKKMEDLSASSSSSPSSSSSSLLRNLVN